MARYWLPLRTDWMRNHRLLGVSRDAKGLTPQLLTLAADQQADYISDEEFQVHLGDHPSVKDALGHLANLLGDDPRQVPSIAKALDELVAARILQPFPGGPLHPRVKLRGTPPELPPNSAKLSPNSPGTPPNSPQTHEFGVPKVLTFIKTWDLAWPASKTKAGANIRAQRKRQKDAADASNGHGKRDGDVPQPNSPERGKSVKEGVKDEGAPPPSPTGCAEAPPPGEPRDSRPGTYAERDKATDLATQVADCLRELGELPKGYTALVGRRVKEVEEEGRSGSEILRGAREAVREVKWRVQHGEINEPLYYALNVFKSSTGRVARDPGYTWTPPTPRPTGTLWDPDDSSLYANYEEEAGDVVTGGFQ